MNTKVRIRLLEVFLCLVLAGVMAGPASAVTTFNMTAGPTTKAMPGGAVVNMWGFSLTSTDVDGTVTLGDGIVKVPGDPLVVPPGETDVTISLTNNLTEPVSLMIQGQSLTANGGPVWADGATSPPSATGSRTAGDFTSRVRSFTHETPVGGTASYAWTNFKSGTYLLQSATNPAKQVQMGLYAAVKKDNAQGEAYPGVSYTKEIIMVYSEVDPMMHAAISGGTYGPGNFISSSLKREPKYFLINGMAFDPTAAGGLNPLAYIDGLGPVLIRFINAGYELHVPEFSNAYVSLVAEDGYPRPYPTEQYSLEMPAGKIYDVMLTPTGQARYAIHDAALHLTNDGTAGPGGMLAYLDVTAVCLADINGDGSVNISDFGVLSAAFGSNPASPNWNPAADLNMDGAVNISDFGILSSEFGRGNCP